MLCSSLFRCLCVFVCVLILSFLVYIFCLSFFVCFRFLSFFGVFVRERDIFFCTININIALIWTKAFAKLTSNLAFFLSFCLCQFCSQHTCFFLSFYLHHFKSHFLSFLLYTSVQFSPNMFLSFLFPIPFLLFTLANFSSNLILPFFLSSLICKSNFLVSIFLKMWSSLQIIFVKRNIHPFS